MTRKVVPYKDEKYYYYYCPTTKKRGCKSAPMIKESDLSDCVLDSVKAHISNVVSLESILSCGDGQQIVTALSKQYMTQITDNEKQLDKISGFKSSLYENMMNGVLSKDDYKSLKEKYTADEKRLRNAIDILQSQLDDVLTGKSERLRWTEHFRQLDNLTELNRRAVVSLIHSIRIISKTEIVITFNYQDEYIHALALIEREAA